jgi:hypothetical protein
VQPTAVAVVVAVAVALLLFDLPPLVDSQIRCRRLAVS